MTKHIVVDIETNGGICPVHNMVSIGAVYHQDPSRVFYGEMRPLNDNYQDIAYQVNGFTHEQVQSFEDPKIIMNNFLDWVTDIRDRDDRIVFVSDTTAFDFSFVNYYLWTFCNEARPFGHAPLSITNLNKGVTGNLGETIYRLRKTKHTHNALDDARGNQEAFTAVLRRLDQQRTRLNRDRMRTPQPMQNTQLADALKGLDREG